MLTAETVGGYLEERGLIRAGATIEVTELGGGVSNVVLGVSADGVSCVVKQSLPRLRVAEEWLAKRERAITEARALEFAAGLVPGAVPRVLDLDREACAFTIERAPENWRTWKDDLLDGRADEVVAHRVGALIADWHAGSRDAGTAKAFADREGFDQLRIDPYYRAVMRVHPDLAGVVGTYAKRLLGPGRCLVHGDYSPKNLLVGHGGLWLIDFEVTHFGEPTFDLAFMLNHLFLKTLHRPDAAGGYLGCARVFWDAYVAGVQAVLAPDAAVVLGQAGCLMVARVDGKSPAEYLTEHGRIRARSLGRWLLTEPPGSLEEAFAAVRAAAGA
jgi:tRNA A-37 threonylcarbamoyl transferase component Bud32